MEATATPKNNFDVEKIILSGKHLIEASAGTGKTHSIAVLVLRLLLEKDILINEILIVTFTEAAVAELEGRVRSFVRLADQYAEGFGIGDEHEAIKNIVDRALARDRQRTQDILKQNLWLLDETAIKTIHGFCKYTLDNYAFEAGQLFSNELIQDTAGILEDHINKFWRKYITTLPLEILSLLNIDNLKLDITSVIKNALMGKPFARYNPLENYTPIRIDQIQAFREQQEAARTQLQTDIFDHIVHRNMKSMVAAIVKQPDFVFENTEECIVAFVQKCFGSSGKLLTNKHIKALPEELVQMVHQYNAFIKDADVYLKRNVVNQLYCFAIQEIVADYNKYFRDNQLYSFDDLIRNMYNVLHVPNTDVTNATTDEVRHSSSDQLVSRLREKFKVLFVDEFQDTDKMQFDIFTTAFGQDTLMFLIGDPKQSIYGFRNADIYTYFTARNIVDYIHEMDVNFRSSVPVISAMNVFFRPNPDFDTFLINEVQNKLTYTEVFAPKSNRKEPLFYNGHEDAGMTIYRHADKITNDTIAQNVAHKVRELLSGRYSIGNILTEVDQDKNEQNEKKDNRIKPKDIGVLVRTNKEGMNIKSFLTTMNIPAVIRDDSRIFDSVEAREVIFVLEVMEAPSIASMRKVLITNLVGITLKQIWKVDEDELLTRFVGYQTLWRTRGVYPALERFSKDFQLEKRWKKKGGGERVLTNFYQLAELLNKEERIKSAKSIELLDWLRRGVGGSNITGDEYATRLESDEDAVNIVTIHKSKGLAYSIVIYAEFNQKSQGAERWVNYRNPNDQQYYSIQLGQASRDEIEWYSRLEAQENRRLLYVAITRAEVKSILFCHNADYSVMLPFVQAIEENTIKEKNVKITSFQLEEHGLYESEVRSIVYEKPIATNFQLSQPNWSRLSYSRISMHAEIAGKPRKDHFEQEYEDFIFRQLRFGAMTGNILHEIFERIDFTNTGLWQTVVEKVLHEYWGDTDVADTQNILQLVSHVMKANIVIDGVHLPLNAITFDNRMSELEFDFTLEPFLLGQIPSIPSGSRKIMVKGFDATDTVEGMMNGKIDLFFRYQGRYYILDWKSNYLGYELEDYNAEGVMSAMDDNNYHLQYLIYTLAVKKYLNSRMTGFDYERDFGGVIYVFIRGAREGQTFGIYTDRPSLELIQKLEEIIS